MLLSKRGCMGLRMFAPWLWTSSSGKWWRARSSAGCLACFLVDYDGFICLHNGNEPERFTPAIPPLMPTVSRILYIASWFLRRFSDEALMQPALPLYGNPSIVAGLLNYLALLDAFDISVGEESETFLVMTAFAAAARLFSEPF